METTTQYPEVLDLPLLAGMPDVVRDRVVRVLNDSGERVKLFEGDTLLHQGGIGGDAGFVLLKGTVRVEREEGPALSVGAPALLGEMYQFNPHAQRTATVTSEGNAEALKFSWHSLYSRAREALSPDEQLIFVESIERCALSRFQREQLMDLPILRDLQDELRLRVCLMLVWMSHHVTLRVGHRLFDQDGLCGDMGYLLAHGEIELYRSNQGSRTIAAPNLLGVIPHFDPDLRWTATAVARNTSELLRFPWLGLVRMIEQRLSAEERRLVVGSMDAHAREHFVH
jgi:hypothetical protein